MRDDAVKDVLNRFNVGEDIMEQLIKKEELKKSITEIGIIT